MQEPAPPTQTPSVRPPLRARLQGLVRNYGLVAFVIYLVIFGINVAGAAIAIRYFGWQPQSAAGTGGLILVSWASAKLLQPLRILLTLALTPLVARLLGRRPRTTQGPQTPASTGT